MAEGKRRLMEAALRQAREKGSTRGLVLRELAREAGLNHNTFYRHFADLESMFQAIIADFSHELRDGLRAARESVPPGQTPSRVVMGWMLDFAHQRPEAFVVAIRELYGPPGPVREAIQAVSELMMDDMVRQLTQLGHLPPLARAPWRRLLRVYATTTFNLCLEYLETPSRRAELIDEAEELFEVLMAGALARGTRQRPKIKIKEG